MLKGGASSSNDNALKNLAAECINAKKGYREAINDEKLLSKFLKRFEISSKTINDGPDHCTNTCCISETEIRNITKKVALNFLTHPSPTSIIHISH